MVFACFLTCFLAMFACIFNVQCSMLVACSVVLFVMDNSEHNTGSQFPLVKGTSLVLQIGLLAGHWFGSCTTIMASSRTSGSCQMHHAAHGIAQCSLCNLTAQSNR